MQRRATRRIFAELLREEWRLHNHRFSGRRFAAFPILIAVLVAGAVELLVLTGTGPDTAIAGVFALAFVFGLHTGSIGFVGRDSLDDLLGELTLLVFSARTLPLSQKRLLAVFVVKDVCYYALLFLLPMTIGAIPAVSGDVGIGGTGWLPGSVGLLWLTLVGTFVLGIGATIAGIGITDRGMPTPALLAVVAVAVAGAWVLGFPVVPFTPYGVFLEPTLAGSAATLALLVGVLLVGALAFDTNVQRPVRTVGPTFGRWHRYVGDPVATKTLLDVHRSSGGFGKVVFSAALLCGVTVALVDLAGQITGVTPSIGISFGAILGLTGFTTYNWLTQFDDADPYLVYPLDAADVFRAKFRSFLMLGPLVGLAAYALPLAWFGTRIIEGSIGAILLVGVACYIFGVTVYITGLSPNEFLFDTLLFGVFGVAMIVPLVPILVVGLALAPVSSPLLAALGIAGVSLGGIGIALYRRAIPKWTARHRQG